MRAMICLYIPPGVAELIAAPMQDQLSGAIPEATEELHITLAYFPEVPDDQRDELLASAARASMYFSPIQTEIEGEAQFYTDDGDPSPYVLLVNPDRLIALRSEVLMNCGALYPAQNHGFIPHITLAYLHGADGTFNPPEVPDIPVLLDTLSVKFGDGERHDFKLGYGGAMTAYRALSDLSEKFDAASNVSETPEHQQSAVPQTKDSDAMTDAMSTEKAGRRMAGSWRDKLGAAIDQLKEVMGWSGYEEEDEDEDKQVKMLNDSPTPLLVFKDNLGQDRWLSYSSNGFQDREKEIVSTKCLEGMIAYADKTGERGPLRLFHAEGFDIGDCDFQAMQGRFLIESGTFHDSPLAQAAKAYIEACSEELGTSIGFTHPLDAFKDGVYEEGIIRERSVCPLVFAANPFTSFSTLKGGAMNSTQEAWLKKAVGDDLFSEVVNRADTATKQLEGQVAFKDNAEAAKAIETLKALAPNDDAKGALDALVLSFAAKADDEKAEDEEDEADGDKAMTALVDTLTKSLAGFSEKLEAKIDASSASVKAEVSAELKTITDRLDKVETATKTAPAAASAFRASASKDNVVDAAEAEKANINHATQGIPASPVAAFVSQIRNGGEGA